MADKSDKPQFPRLIICEGPEDQFFFSHLIDAWGLARFHVWSSGGPGKRGGKSKFEKAIRAFEVQRPKTFHSLRDIILVADNDQSPDQSFAAVCEQIEKRFGQGTSPKRPRERTTKIKPAVSVLMIPWDKEKGHLERLCMLSARDSDKTAAGHVDSFMAMLCAEKWNNESRQGKAWLRANLAARCESDPFVALGHVFDQTKYAGLIPLKHNSFKQIVDFLSTFDVQAR